MENEKRFVAYYYCNGCSLSLGLSIHFQKPNIEIHLPFGFVRIGWTSGLMSQPIGELRGYRFLYRAFGYRTWG